jgi:hypothetical protein
MTDEVFNIVARLMEHPPRSIPRRFNTANVMEETVRTISRPRFSADARDFRSALDPLRAILVAH